ncbi:MAG: OadG family transporter subunit [Verrucomicrobia bacterium]|nr:OadG family transporter subunit [Verrucomicrobiota bacterium]
MPQLLLPAAATQSGASVLDAMPHLLGMLVVMITLTMLWGVCSLTAYLVKRAMPATAPHAAPTPAAAPAAAAAIPPEIIVVIAAAVSSVLGKDHRMVSVKSQDSNWERAGRQSVLSSHGIR